MAGSGPLYLSTPVAATNAIPRLPAAPARARWLMAAPLVVAVATAAGIAGLAEVTRRLHAPLPMVARVDIHSALFETTSVALTVTAAGERVPTTVPQHRLLADHTLWERMHVADWNAVTPAVRGHGLDAMLARYSDLLLAPDRWDRMTAHDWDRVPQPIRALAYRHMVEYWVGFYALARLNDVPPGLVSDTVAAIVMSESWFEHRGVFVNRDGSQDIGLGGASERARERMRVLYKSGLVDVYLEDQDYYNPWRATRFVAIWMSMLLSDTHGDLDYAVRAYNRGLRNAFDQRGDRYLAAVHRRRERFIRNVDAPAAWDHLWRRDRDARRHAWPWIVHTTVRAGHSS